MFDNKDYIIMKNLVSDQESFSIFQAAKQLKTSTRTIYYALNKLNEFLTAQQVNTIDYSKENTTMMSDETKDYLSQFIDKALAKYYILSQEERIQLALLHSLLIEEKLNVQYFEKMFNVSRNTILNDFKLLRNKLLKFHCLLEYSASKGYFIDGTNLRKRSVLFMVINDLREKPFLLKKQFYHEQDYYTAIKLVDALDVHFGEMISYDMKTYLHQVLAILMKYPQEKIHLTDDEEKLFNKPTYLKAKALLPNTLIHEAEFIFFHYLDIKTQSFKIKDESYLKDIVSLLIQQFKQTTLIQFKEEDSLFKGLMFHMSQSLIRYKYGIRIENTMKDLFKAQYYPIYQLTKKTVEAIEDLISYPISEDDITYIAMHFGGHLRRENQTVSLKKIYIVCEHGLATAYLLKNALEDLFDNIEIVDVITRNDVALISQSFDHLIATVKINDNPHKDKTVYISPVLSETEKAYLSILFNKSINMTQYAEHIFNQIKPYLKEKDFEEVFNILKTTTINPTNQEDLSNYLHIDFITEKSKVKDYTEAVQLSAAPLLEAGKITQAYIDKILSNISTLGPYIVVTEKIAISHARPNDGALENGISALILKEPVEFPNQHNIHMIFTLSASSDEIHLNLLSLLSEWIEANLTLLNRCIHKSDLMNLIKT